MATKVGKLLGLLAAVLFAASSYAQSPDRVDLAFYAGTQTGAGNPIHVNCTVGCSGGTTDTDDNSVASGQSTGIQIGLGYVYNGANWVRMLGDSTNGLTVQCATGCSGGTQYTEDAAAAANPIGSAINLVRQDTPAGLVTTDGDNVTLRGTNYGAAYVTLLDTGGSPVSVGGGTQYTEDAAAAANPVGTALNLVRADSLAGLTTTDGDNVAARGTDKGELYVKHVDAIPVTQSGTWDEVGINDSGNSITVDNGGTFAVQASVAAAATSIGKAEDAGHSDGDVGVPPLAVRDDTLNARSGAENDYEPLHTDANGALWVIPSGNVTVVGTGTFATQVDSLPNEGQQTMANSISVAIASNQSAIPITDGAGALNVICDSGCGGAATFEDDDAFTPGTTAVNISAAEVDDTGTTAATENSAAALRMSTRRELYTQIRDAAGNERGVNVNASNQLAIAGPVTNAGTFAVQVDGNALTALQLIDDPVSVLGTATYTEAATKGMIIGCVRRDADTTLVDTTNEIAPCIVDAAGKLKVEAFNGGDTFQVQSNSANLATQTTVAAIQTSVELQDDTVYTDDTSTHATGTSKGTLIMGAATPTDTAVNANDIGAVGMTNNRELYVSLRDISGAAAVTGSGNATGALRVELANNGTGLVGLNAGTNAIGKLAANSGVDIGDVDVTSISGQTAEDTAAANAEVVNRNGCVRNDADGTAFTDSGTDGDWTHISCDRYGTLMVNGMHPLQWTYHENSSSALTDTTVHASCGSGLYNYITSVTFSTGGATAASILIEDSTTTTILGPWYLEAVAGRGLHVTFPTPKKQTNAATLISVTTTGAVTHGLEVQGFCGP